MAAHPGVPLFLAGLGLGAIVVLDDAIDEPEGLRGVITAAAPVGEIKMSRLATSLAGGLPRLPQSFRCGPVFGSAVCRETRRSARAIWRIRCFISGPPRAAFTKG